MVAIAVTGASGLVGTRLLSVLAGEPSVTRLVGLDVAEPERRARGLEFHRADVAHSELKPLLEGIDVLVHLATVVDPIPDERLMARVNVEGTRRVLDAAAAVGVNKVVRVSSAAVYGAWPNNPVPLTEDAPLRPNSAFSPAVQGAEVERLLAEWRDEHPGSIVTTLRTAPVVGPGAGRLGSRLLLGRPPLRVRGAAPPVQATHVDDLVSALALVVLDDHPGTFNVASDGWLDEIEARPHGSLDPACASRAAPGAHPGADMGERPRRGSAWRRSLPGAPRRHCERPTCGARLAAAAHQRRGHRRRPSTPYLRRLSAGAPSSSQVVRFSECR